MENSIEILKHVREDFLDDDDDHRETIAGAVVGYGIRQIEAGTL